MRSPSVRLARFKTIETRHWATAHEGAIAIHAAKRMTRAEQEFIRELRSRGVAIPYTLPLGAIVAIARLVECRRVETIRDTLGPTERALGNYGDGRFAWILADIRPLAQPIPCRGAQGLFTIPAAMLEGAQ